MPEYQLAIEAALADSGVIERVIHVRTLHLGPDELLVVAKVAVVDDGTSRSIAVAIDEAEAAMRQVVPEAKFIFIEPDIQRVDG